MLFNCENCSFSTNKLYNYERHLKNKYACANLILTCSNCNKKYKKKRFYDAHISKCKKIKKEKPPFKCKFCQIVFNRKYNRDRHIPSCKLGKLQHNQSNNHQTTHQFPTNQQNANTIVNGNVINNVDNSIKNIDNSVKNINIFNFGSEKLDYITPAMLEKCYSDPTKAISNISQIIHFHPGHPENHNIKVDPTNSDFIKIHTNGQWNYKSKKIILEALAKCGFSILEKRLDECLDNMNAEKQENWDDYYIEYLSHDEKTLKETNHNIMVMVFTESNKLNSKLPIKI